MIDPGLYVAFVLVSAALIVIPGPNVLLIVATSLSSGRTSGLATVAGSTCAMALQLCIAALGTAWLAVFLAEAFGVLKWLGVAYLVYLGIGRLRAAMSERGAETAAVPSGRGSFWRGFFVSLTNPKTILFFGAFLPQFVNPDLSAGPQLAVLSVSFLVLAIVFDSAYAILAGSLRRFVHRPIVRRSFDGFAGTLFVGSGIGLAVARRSQG